MTNIDRVSQKALGQIRDIEQMDGKKGISTAQERNALSEALSNGEITGGANVAYAQSLINEYDVKDTQKGASKNVVDTIKKAMAMEGDKKAIDSDKEVAVLDAIIDNTTGQYSDEDIKYAKAMKRSFGLSDTTPLGAERARNEDLEARNADLETENTRLEAENKLLLEQLEAKEKELEEMERVLDVKLASLGDENEKLKGEIRALKGNITDYRRKLNSYRQELTANLPTTNDKKPAESNSEGSWYSMFSGEDEGPAGAAKPIGAAGAVAGAEAAISGKTPRPPKSPTPPIKTPLGTIQNEFGEITKKFLEISKELGEKISDTIVKPFHPPV